MSKIDIDSLADAVMKELMDFKDMTEEELEEIAKEVAKEGRKKLKSTSPRGSGSEKGHYADGWSVTYVREGNGKIRFIIHNKRNQPLHICWSMDTSQTGEDALRGLPM